MAGPEPGSAQFNPGKKLRDHEPPDPDVALLAGDEMAGVDAQRLGCAAAGVIICEQQAEAEAESGRRLGTLRKAREGRPGERHLVNGAA